MKEHCAPQDEQSMAGQKLEGLRSCHFEAWCTAVEHCEFC